MAPVLESRMENVSIAVERSRQQALLSTSVAFACDRFNFLSRLLSLVVGEDLEP